MSSATTVKNTDNQTTSPTGKFIFWGLCALLAFGLFHLFEGILLPFVLGALIAYLLNPLIHPLEGMGAPRWLSALGLSAMFFIFVTLLLLILIPVISREVMELIQNLPHYIQTAQEWVAPHLERLSPYLGDMSQIDVSQKFKENAQQALNIGSHVFGGVVAGTQALAGFTSTLFLTPIVAFYMMMDWPHMTRNVKGLFPREYKDTMLDLLGQIDRSIAGFIRGQVSVCVILGLIYGVALIAMGLKFGFVIGLSAGLLSFIPFVGSAIGLVASTLVAWFQFGTFDMVGIALAIFVVGQLIEGNLLTPKFIGDSIQLHPLWIIFALMAGGSLMGFTGMLVALPVAAVIGVLVRFSVSRYKQSAFYGQDGTTEAPKKTSKPKAKAKTKAKK